ncbi:HD domain-containing protein [Candidatus Bathyarchaeota archaeon A05DMB-2]|nr:HD domain-containing protein [Candidatus Bathyarchaeota archaeon A05DMB-2]
MIEQRKIEAFPEQILAFLDIVGRLKKVRRTGWISHAGITKPESVADHSFRCAILAMCIGDLCSIDTERLIKMLLLHDIHEALIGDYDYYMKKQRGISEVKAEERSAARNILLGLPPKVRKHYSLIWREFEEQNTSEAILANDIDKIEMIMQAMEYERDGYDAKRFDAFWTDVPDKIKNPAMRALLKLLEEKRTVLKRTV